MCLNICFDGVVVITSALHAEGREFDPRSKYFCKFEKIFILKNANQFLLFLSLY